MVNKCINETGYIRSVDVHWRACADQQRTYGGTDQIKGTVFQVWLQIIAVVCNMDAATSVLPWDATEAVVDVSVAGVEIQGSLPDTMGLEGHTRHATRSRILILVVFGCLSQMAKGLIRVFMM